MTSSVGNTIVFSIVESTPVITGVGNAVALSVVCGTTVSGVGATIALTINISTSVSSVGQPLVFNIAAGNGLPDINATVTPLSTSWAFQEDPTLIGITDGWYASGFNTSAWPTILSGKGWESQFPGLYSGYGWYVQTVPLSIPLFNQWVILDVGICNGNIDVWWNGTLLTGFYKGNYKYQNVEDVQYYLPPNVVLDSNTLAVRCWGGNLDGLNNSGLASSGLDITLASTLPMWARPGGGDITTEIPLGAYDLSSAQNGTTFDLVLRLQNSQVSGLSNPYITYSLVNSYDGGVVAAGLQAVTLGSDGIYRAIIPVTGQNAVGVYLTGNVEVQWNVINYVPGPMTDTGQQLVVNTGGTTSYTMEIWSQTWPAGTVVLPPDGSNIQHSIYLPIIPSGVALSNLVVDDTLTVGGIADSTYWSFETNLQVGSIVNGDRTYTIETLPSLVTGMQFIQTSANSKFWGGSPPAQGPMATFTVGATTTVYLAIDVRVVPSLWAPTGLENEFVIQQTPQNSVTYNMQFFGQFATAGSTVTLPADGNDGVQHGFYFVAITDNTVVISDLVVYDTSEASLWSVQTNLQAGDVIYSDRTYTFQSLPSYWAGAQWIQTPNNSKGYGGVPFGLGPMAQFVVSKDCYIWLAVDTRVPVPGAVTSTTTAVNFAARDSTQLPALSPVTYVETPLGNLKLIDIINCSTPIISEPHPYMQGGFGGSHLEDFHTPGSSVIVNIQTILGQACRTVDYGYFAYRIGAGTLKVGQQYVIALTYPEDVPRYQEMEIQAGQSYIDVGWKNGLVDNIYDPWPVSGQYQTFYQIFGLGAQTTGMGGAEAGDATLGVWLYIMGKVSLPNSYWSIYTNGCAISTISLYEIDPVANAPVINLPVGLPQRIITFDWERPPSMPVADICNYAVLMGYNTISPLVGMKWGADHYAPPLAGYDAAQTDPQWFLCINNYNTGSGIPPTFKFPGPSLHEQFLTETAAVGLNYIPRFEYGGSADLPVSAQAINAAGSLSKPDRYGNYSANLVNAAVFTEMQAVIANLVAPFTGHSNFKGLFWRMRRDTMQVSYGVNDVAAFTAATGNVPPGGLNAAQLAMWASTNPIQPIYSAWWQGVRAAFHYACLTTLQSYRSDMIMLYYNWDSDKWAMLNYDLNSAAFYGQLAQHGATVAYGSDLTLRESYTSAEYINALSTGFFSTAVEVGRPDALWPDYAITPSLYTNPGFRVFCPVNYAAYAQFPDYINYFQTADGVAVAHAVSYDEISAREPNPKYEGNMQIPGSGSISMAMECMSWAASDVNTLTFTAYTFGRGFADAHRAFAQAFLALPDIDGELASGMPTNITVRTYPSGSVTYVGMSNTATVSQMASVNIPGSWPAYASVTNLVTNQTSVVPAGSALPLSMVMAPMQLSAFLVEEASGPPPPVVVYNYAGASM